MNFRKKANLRFEGKTIKHVLRLISLDASLAKYRKTEAKNT